MYMLSASREHLILDIIPFKGHLNANDTKRIQEGNVVKFNRYHIASKRKTLEELANNMKEEWIRDAQEKIKQYSGLKVKIK